MQVFDLASAGPMPCFCFHEYKVDHITSHVQVLSHLSELETTLEAGIEHRDKALTSIGLHLAKWMKMVGYDCCIFFRLNSK